MTIEIARIILKASKNRNVSLAIFEYPAAGRGAEFPFLVDFSAASISAQGKSFRKLLIHKTKTETFCFCAGPPGAVQKEGIDFMRLVWQLICDGLAMGLVYVILAAGNVLLCSVNKMIFVAYAMFYTIGSYFIWAMVTYTAIPFFASLLLAVLGVAVLACLSYILVFKKHQLRITDGGFLPTMIASMGLNMVLNQLILIIFGTTGKSIPSVFPGMVQIFGATITKDKLMLMVVGVVITFVLFYIFRKTRFGRAMRAVAIDSEAAALQGIKANTVYMLTLMLACSVAGLAGGVLAPSYGISPSMGSNILWTVQLMTMFGGMDSLPGAVIGGIVIGEILSFGQYFIGGTVQVIVFLVIGIVLYFRPNGLLGHNIDIGI